jgi:anti-sigma B factor antagonist
MDGLSLELVHSSPPVLHVRGDLDMANAEEFGAALKQALSADSTLVLGLAGLSFIDGAGLRVIVDAAESRDGVGPLTLVNASRVARLLDLVGLDARPAIEFAQRGDGRGR